MDESFPSRLSPSDSLMWHIERDPVLRSPIVVVGLLDRDPGWLAFRATFEGAVERLPRLRQRIERNPLRQLRWVDDEAFSLDYHLRRVRAPQPSNLRSVLDVVTPAATAAFDPARPLWECTLFDGLEGGRAALALKFHHTLTDGVGGIDLARDVFDHSRAGDAHADPPTRPVAPQPRSLRTAAHLVETGVDQLIHPARMGRGLVRLGRSAAHMLAPAGPSLSPLFSSRGLDRHLDVIEVPLAALRTAAADTGVTVNAVFLSAVGGALHDFHQRLGESFPAMRVTMPVNIRAEGDAPGGNHFVPVRFTLAIDDPDPRERSRLAAAITGRERAEPAMKLTDAVATVLDWLPEPVVSRLFGTMLKNVDLDAVDLQGLKDPVYVGGARIDRMWAFAPPTGAAVSVTLLSHLDTACVSILTDVAAVPEPALLTTCMQGAFDEILFREGGRRVS